MQTKFFNIEWYGFIQSYKFEYKIDVILSQHRAFNLYRIIKSVNRYKLCVSSRIFLSHVSAYCYLNISITKKSIIPYSNRSSTAVTHLHGNMFRKVS